jgi:hypothetical protein|tara:strand:- start:114 stop:740 length:627 start_codon:yes stop_codon:yes gene_type:complete
MFKNLMKKIKSKRGNSLAEFAVTTAMMATLATTAAPRFSGVGEAAKERKTEADIDKITQSAMNFYNDMVVREGRGRFPGQIKYDEGVGGYETEDLLLSGIAEFDGYDNMEGSKWVSVFSTNHPQAGAPSGHNISTTEDDNFDEYYDMFVGAEEFLDQFGRNAIKSPFQDGHYIYVVIPGGGAGNSSYSPILYVADLENPTDLHKKLQP